MRVFHFLSGLSMKKKRVCCMQTSENLLVRPLGFSNADGIISSAGLKQTDFTQKIFRTSFVREVCVIYWWRKIPLEFYGRKESWLWIEAENFSHFSFTLCWRWNHHQKTVQQKLASNAKTMWKHVSKPLHYSKHTYDLLGSPTHHHSLIIMLKWACNYL